MSKRRIKDGLNKFQRKWINPPKDQPWAQLPVEIIESAAWRRLSVNKRRVLDVLICHHFRLHQTDNGDLQVSYSLFEKAGVTRRMIAPSIRGLEGAGFIQKRKGIPRNGLRWRPILYGLPMFERKETQKFVFIPLDVMESPAWRKLSLAARRVMDCLLIENFRHKRKLNGALRVSFRQLVKCGIHRCLIASAINELVAAGLLKVARAKAWGSPNLYQITFLGTLDGAPTWRKSTAPTREKAMAKKNPYHHIAYHLKYMPCGTRRRAPRAA
jgi:hypothetical protein